MPPPAPQDLRPAWGLFAPKKIDYICLSVRRVTSLHISARNNASWQRATLIMSASRAIHLDRHQQLRRANMSLSDLSKGSILRMLHNEQEYRVEEAVCQVLTVKKLQSANTNTPDRYRVVLNDGELYAQGKQNLLSLRLSDTDCIAMLASQTTHFVESNQLERNCLIKILNYTASTVQTRRILILLDIEVVAGPTEDRLGDPQNYEKVYEANNAMKVDQPTKKEETPMTNAPSIRKDSTPAADLSRMPVYPIEGLSPYQNKWTIKARVTTKSEIKHWSNQRGEGKLFSCNFLDESGEIKATGFNDQVDRLYNVLKEGHVYYVSKARVTIARKKFSTLSNEYEITFERDTQVSECPDSTDVPEVKFNFVALDALDGVEPKQTCDVIGIVERAGELSEIVSKASQKPVSKRELTLVDQTGMTVRLTLWGKTAENYGGSSGHAGCGFDDKPVIAFKGVSVSDFGGRSLSMFSSSTMHPNPDIPEAHGLRGWYDTEGGMIGQQGNFKTYNNAGLGGTGILADAGANMKERKTISQAKDANLGMSDKPDYFNMLGTVIYVKHDNLTYPACPSDGCNKKVTEESQDSWRCERCDRSYSAPEHRYILQANVQDHTGSLWINGFNDIGESIIGMPAGELVKLKEEGDDTEYSAVLGQACGQMLVFNIRAKQDIYNDTPRVRYTVTKMSNVNFVKEGNELVESFKAVL